MRTLIYVPIVHTELDMGSLAPSLKQAYVERYGEEKWQQHENAIHEMWDGIRTRLEERRLDCESVRIYQDGLPVCGKEYEIVKDLAQAGSLNHVLVAEYLDRGAMLMGTEDPALLLRELRTLQELVRGGGKTEPSPDRERQAQDLLDRRDRFIAARIGETLRDAETGILFIGLAHRVERYLPQDLRHDLLIHRLPFGREIPKRQGEESDD